MSFYYTDNLENIDKYIIILWWGIHWNKTLLWRVMPLVAGLGKLYKWEKYFLKWS